MTFRTYLRELEEEDANISYKWRNDKEVWKHTGSRPDRRITPEIERDWITKVKAQPTSLRFAIVIRETDKYIGNIQLTDITEDEAQYHIFIGDKDEWGKGFAKEASVQLIDHAKHHLYIKKIFLLVDPTHSVAIQLYKSLGFEQINDEVRMELDLELKTKDIYD